ncbi:hypothetical protein [Streptomyces zaomyceticus]|uniref:hypothetical protein n=1 Tax=Streptomyces zaomyceticus TaxID=68286 RepID=UPI00386C023B
MPRGARRGGAGGAAARRRGARVAAHNPYGDEYGVTVADPDGYRLVLCSRTWEIRSGGGAGESSPTPPARPPSGVPRRCAPLAGPRISGRSRPVRCCRRSGAG